MKIGNLKIILEEPLVGATRRHGAKADPSRWSWWRRFYLAVPIGLPDVRLPSTGYRIWFYKRNKAWNLDFYFDRRSTI
jgi:hypothetical protein